MLEYGLTIDIDRVCEESVLVEELLELDGKDLLELGCGGAEKTRALARAGTDRRVLALEVDEVQHARNLELEGLDNVRFALGGAQDIPAPDGSFDAAFLFKSLHHVPVAEMDRGLAEVARTLRPGGYAYVSEPLYRDEFNDLLRLFNDEGRVRREAFAALERAIESGRFELVSQTFFRSPLHFADFKAFEEAAIRVTHSHYVLSDETLNAVREGFARLEGEDGVRLAQPIRVDLLQRPVEK